LKPKSMKAASLTAKTHGLVKNELIRTLRTRTAKNQSCWGRSCPPTTKAGPFFGAVARILDSHQMQKNCSLGSMLARTVPRLVLLKLLVTLSFKRAIGQTVGSKSRPVVAPEHCLMLKSNRQSTNLIKSGRIRQRLLLSLK
jgi:hypothetical protein